MSPFRLLKRASPYQLCLTCHNGSGSQLDVFDGVRLDARETPNAAVVGVAAVPGFTLSVAPDSTRHTPAGGTVEYTVAVIVTSYVASTNFTLSVSEVPNADFLPSSLTATSLTIECCQPAYMDLVVRAAPGAPAGAQLLTVTVTSDDAMFGPQTGSVTTQTRVGDPIPGATLNGGGFRFVNGAPVTSRHNADPADDSAYPWGFIYPTSGQEANTGRNPNWLGTALQCTSCHNPHGSDNYRMLRDRLFGIHHPPGHREGVLRRRAHEERGRPGTAGGRPRRQVHPRVLRLGGDGRRAERGRG